jgi:hypothetical protein
MAPRWFRIEHRTEEGVTALGRAPDLFPHPTALAPWVSRLLLAGATGGLVVLVDEATGGEVARHDLRRGPRRVPRGPAARTVTT